MFWATPFYDTDQVVCLPEGALGGRSTSLAVETRWLPHGCIYEHWQTCNTMFPDARSSFQFFWATWQASWLHKLSFRGQLQHAVRSTWRRTRQIKFLSDHGLGNYKHRRFLRAKSWSLMAKSCADSPAKVVVQPPQNDEHYNCGPLWPIAGCGQVHRL